MRFVFIPLISLICTLNSWATNSQVLLSFLNKAECAFHPEAWVELGEERCLFIAPFSGETREARQLAHYKRWIGFIDEYMIDAKNPNEITDARILLWYIEQQRDVLQSARDKEFVDVFFPLKEAVDHLERIKLSNSSIPKRLLLHQLQSVFSAQRIEDEWLRLVIKQKEYKNAVFTEQERIQLYLSKVQTYQADLKRMLGADGFLFVEELSKGAEAYHAYLKSKIIPRAQVSNEAQRSWWQTKFLSLGGEGFLSKIASESLEELSKTENQLKAPAGEAKPDSPGAKNQPTRIQAFYLSQTQAYKLGSQLYFWPNESSQQKSVLEQRRKVFVTAHVAARFLLGKMSEPEAKNFLQQANLFLAADLPAMLTELKFGDPLRPVLQASGYLSFKYIEEKMRLLRGKQFSLSCLQGELLALGPLPWELLEESLRQSQVCLDMRK